MAPNATFVCDVTVFESLRMKIQFIGSWFSRLENCPTVRVKLVNPVVPVTTIVTITGVYYF